jgi:hypothetical protein
MKKKKLLGDLTHTGLFFILLHRAVAQLQYQDLTEMKRDVKCKVTYHKWIQSVTDAEVVFKITQIQIRQLGWRLFDDSSSILRVCTLRKQTITDIMNSPSRLLPGRKCSVYSISRQKMN